MRQIRVHTFFILLIFVLTSWRANAQLNVDSIVTVYSNIDSDEKLNSFVGFIEKTVDVLGMATQMGIDTYQLLVHNAAVYSEKSSNEKVKRRCLLYELLAPTEYTKLEQMKKPRSLSLHEDIQESAHYMKILQSLRYIYGDLELFDQFLPMVDEIRKHNKGEYSDDDIEYMRLSDRSSMYYKTKNYRKALEVFDQIGKINTKKIDLNESSRLNNMGLCYQNMRKADSALIFFRKAIELYNEVLQNADKNKTNADSSFYFVVMSNMADVRVEQGIYLNAEAAFQGQLRYSSEYYSPHLRLSSFLSIAKLEYQRNNFKRSLAYIDSIRLEYNKSTLVNYYINALKLKTKIHLVQGKKRLAALSEEKYESMLDSIRASKAELNYQAAAIKLEVNETKQKLSATTLDLNEAKSKSRTLRFGLGIASLFICLIIWVLYVFRKKNKLLSNQKENIDKALQERELLLREIHHRVKNNLNIISSLIQLQSRRIKNEDVKSIFKESQNYILSMSKVHQHLYEQEDVKEVDVDSYFKSLLAELIISRGDKSISYNIHSEEVRLKLDQALVLGILTSELVTNSLKHAFTKNSGNISVELRKEGDTCYYCYRDSGQGFSMDKIRSQKTFGLKLIRMSAEQLRGDLILKTEGEFLITISFITK